jgi:uncharacterized protein YndB with AHSA1/START domain
MISIKKEVVVEASQETCFEVFSRKMDLWWPRSHHVGKSPLVEMVLEPKAGGRWYSTHEDGEQCSVGYVQDFEPHSRLVLVWQLNGEFQLDPELHTEVELAFIADQPQRTIVKFEHRGVEKLGKAVEGMNQGWGMIMDLYALLAKDGKLSGEALKLYQRQTVAA